MPVAHETDLEYLLVDDPGQKLQEGDARVVEVVVRPLRGMAGYARPRLFDQWFEIGVVESGNG